MAGLNISVIGGFVGAQSIAYSPVSTLTLFPHPQQRRLSNIDGIYDAHVCLAGVLTVALTEDVVKTSEIEGEQLNVESVIGGTSLSRMG